MKSIYFDKRIYEGVNEEKVSWFNPDIWKSKKRLEMWLNEILTSYPCPAPHPFVDGQDVTGLYEVKTKCASCGGDGKETCNNPDHGFISGVGGQIGRLGCPVCGHDEDLKVGKRIDGKKVYNKCEWCKDGYMTQIEYESYVDEYDSNVDLDLIALPKYK